MNELKAQLSTPGLCYWAFRRADNTAVVWDPNTKVAIDHIELDPDQSGSSPATLLWKVGSKLTPKVTLDSIELRQPDPSDGEPNTEHTTVQRRPGDSPAAAPINYHSYLAKLIISFKSQGIGGVRRARSMYINVQLRNAPGQIEHCYPTVGLETTKGSFLNEMGTVCPQSDPTASCVVAGCTTWVLQGFKADGSPRCACTCRPTAISGDPLNCYSGASSSGTWICPPPTTNPPTGPKIP